MEDLTLASFAYLRLPLRLPVGFSDRSCGHNPREETRFRSATLMMVLFFHAARLAMVTFDPFLSSRPL